MSTFSIRSTGKNINAEYRGASVRSYSSFPSWGYPKLTINLANFAFSSLGDDLTSGQTFVGLTSGGLYGQYFSGEWRSVISTGNIGTLPLSDPTLYTAIDYPSRGDSYGFIAIGYFIPPESGTYTFYTSSDDSSGVWIGDIASATSGRTATNAVLNNNLGEGQGNTKRSGTIDLIENTPYAIRIVHEEITGGDNLTFSWAGPSIAETTDLAQHFYYYESGNDYSASQIYSLGLQQSEQIIYTPQLYTKPSISFKNKQSVVSTRPITSATIEEKRVPILSSSKTTPYDITELKKQEGSIKTITASRMIDSSAEGGGGTIVVAGTEKQTWY